mgnify:CR=1 FL=1
MQKIDVDAVKVVSSSFMNGLENVVNVPRVKEVFIQKCYGLMTKCGDGYYFISDIKHEMVSTKGSDYHYFYFESISNDFYSQIQIQCKA